jgi:hypothetical protein
VEQFESKTIVYKKFATFAFAFAFALAKVIKFSGFGVCQMIFSF